MPTLNCKDTVKYSEYGDIISQLFDKYVAKNWLDETSILETINGIEFSLDVKPKEDKILNCTLSSNLNGYYVDLESFDFKWY